MVRSPRFRAASTSRCPCSNRRRRRARPPAVPPGAGRAKMDSMTTQPVATRDPGALLAATRVKLGEFEYEIGPLGHLAAQRERLESLSWRAFEATPLAATIGAEIDGVGLGDHLPDATI